MLFGRFARIALRLLVVLAVFAAPSGTP